MDDRMVTAVLINYRTPDLAMRALSSFRKAYPAVGVVLIDNSPAGEQEDFSVAVRRRYPEVTFVGNRRNIHHGPAMHQAMGLIPTPLALFLDSDCAVLQSGFIERMAARLFENARHYAAGTLQYVNKRGFPVDRSHAAAIPYINPWCMLVKKDLYRELPRFERLGAPVLKNMIGVRGKGLVLVEVPLDGYVHHDHRGTAARFGYRLGIKGRLNYLLNRLGL
ncbi:MAG: glycosyltransferase [Chitinispirillaceae bacterium]|nr:glycosyltransferase [Chitinispirillaceae bacterium]